MRTLVGLIFILPSVLFAEPASWGLVLNSSSYEGVTSASADDPGVGIDTLSQEFKYSSGLVQNKGRVRFNVKSIKRDLNDYITIAEGGKELALADSFDGKETIAGVGGDFQIAGLTLSIDGEKTLSDSPLETESLSGGIAYSNYPNGFNIGYKYTYRNNSRPTSIITLLENFETFNRDTGLTQRVHELSYDQILREDLKMIGSISFQEENQDRPNNKGAKFGLMYAPLDLLGLMTSVERVVESEDFLPRDGRGLFDLTAYSFGASYEITYNFLVKLLYTVTIETETARNDIDEQKVGTDAVAIGLEGRSKRFVPSLLASMEQSNTGRKSQLLSVGFSWEL